jgi:superfamily I DNA/RNA helicase
LLHWGTGAPRVEQLRARGVLVLEWAAWRRETAGWLRPGAHDDRQTLEPPGCTRLAELRDKEAVAVLGVELASLDDVRCLHETLLVPVLRAGMPLLVESERTPEELDDAAFVEPGFEHAATLERMRWLCARARDGDVGFARVSTQPPYRSLDDAQLAAARAPGGVVQVIAPAGSGKTTVLIERVRELLARSADPDRILCMTFNDAAAAELRERLEAAGAGRVAARTFHSVGHRIIRAHRLVEGRTLHAEGWTVAQWARFGRLAAEQVGAPPPEAAELPHELAAIRLGELATSAEWERACPRDDHSRCVARVYTLVEREKDRRRLYDFDDMIVLAVRLLRGDRSARERWQTAFDHVLVDEYQDIEPAQELLVRMLAAPHDDLFVVGDEDQTLYGWRRASVHRMIDLDATYLALHRVALEHNYRCTPEVIRASAALIANNALRFPKPITRVPGRASGGPRAIRIAHYRESEHDEGARLLARKLVAYSRADIAVLGRTINALRPYALAAAASGVRISGPEELFEAAGAQETLEAYFAVFGDPSRATEADVRVMLRRPSRGLGQDAATRICEALARGDSLPEAVERLPAAASEHWRLVRAAEQFSALAGLRDAAAFIRRLRQDGLDRHFDEVARAPRGRTATITRCSTRPSKRRPANRCPLTPKFSPRGACHSEPRATTATASSSPPCTAPRAGSGRASSSWHATKACCRTATPSRPAPKRRRPAKAWKPSAASPTSRSRAQRASCRSFTPPSATAASCMRPGSLPRRRSSTSRRLRRRGPASGRRSSARPRNVPGQPMHDRSRITSSARARWVCTTR